MLIRDSSQVRKSYFLNNVRMMTHIATPEYYIVASNYFKKLQSQINLRFAIRRKLFNNILLKAISTTYTENTRKGHQRHVSLNDIKASVINLKKW